MWNFLLGHQEPLAQDQAHIRHSVHLNSISFHCSLARDKEKEQEEVGWNWGQALEGGVPLSKEMKAGMGGAWPAAHCGGHPVASRGPQEQPPTVQQSFLQPGALVAGDTAAAISFHRPASQQAS